MSLRIRQIVLAARSLPNALAQVQSTLVLPVTYRDPEVAKFGLENAMMAIGDQFLEVVAPIRADTAAGRHLDRHGDSAYMLILQTDDLDRERARLTQLGIRIVWESTQADIRAIHLHPKDVGGAIVSLDEATPPSSWRWAGPDWRAETSTADRIVAATIAAHDPAALSQRWAQVLGRKAREVGGRWRIDIEDGALEFISSSDGAERIVEFGVRAPSLRLPAVICGTRFEAGI